MRRFLALCALLVAVPAAGCGGSKPSVPTPKQVTPAPGHACTADNYAMQCALFGQPHPGLTLAQSVPSRYGVDWAWGGPRTCSAMHALGATFASSYLSFDPSKGWTPSLASSLHACGIATTAVWETGGTRALGGYPAGASDANEAKRQMLALGGAGRPITFAIDFDANGPDVYGYFQGCHAVLGPLCNAYGGYRPLLYLYQHGLVGHWNWQTYAWSGGAWLPASIAPLEQYLNGNAFDNDRAIAPDFGQFPAPRPPGPSQATIRTWRHNREQAFTAYHARGCKSPQDPLRNSAPASFGAPNVCRDQGAAVIRWQQKLWTVVPRWPLFGPRVTKAGLRTEVAWVVRSEVNYWSGARHATGSAYAHHRCPGLVGNKRGHKGLCGILSSRWRYFNAKASGTVRAYS